MTEAEWLACDEPAAMLKAICDRVDERKMRLFALAGCRRIEHFLTTHEKCSRGAIAVLERRIEGTANESDLRSSLSAIAMSGEMYGHVRNPGHAAGYALLAATEVVYCVRDSHWEALTEDVGVALAYDALTRSRSRDLQRIDALWMKREFDEAARWHRHENEIRCFPEFLAALKVERSNQAELLRDIIGNPFRLTTFLPEWRTSTALALAQQMYESRDFSAMPILADALEDANCTDEAILTHCRGQGPHVRGCWGVDLVLGKE